MTVIIFILVALCYLVYVVPKRAERNERRYWSPKQIEKRWKQAEQKRKDELSEWYNSTITQNAS